MSIHDAMDKLFKERAVELMRGIGVEHVTTENLMRPPYVEQFKAMLMDAKRRFDPATENYASLCRLIEECERVPPAPPNMGTGGDYVHAGGTGFMVPKLEEPLQLVNTFAQAAFRKAKTGAGFCRHCGASIPPREGEGTCDKCDPKLGGDPVAAEHRPT